MNKKEVDGIFEKLEYEIEQKVIYLYGKKLDEQAQKIHALEQRLKVLEESVMWVAHDININNKVLVMQQE